MKEVGVLMEMGHVQYSELSTAIKVRSLSAMIVSGCVHVARWLDHLYDE